MNPPGVRSRSDVDDDASRTDTAAVVGSQSDVGAIRNTLSGLLTQATTAAFTAVLTVYLARALGESGYGVFALALSIGAIALLVSDAGISHAAARFIAERHTDQAAVADVAAGALRVTAITAVLSAGLLCVLANPIAGAYGKPALAWPLRGVALAVAGQSILLMYLRIFAGVRRVGLGVKVVFIESLLETTASIALVALGAGVTGAAFGRAIGYSVGAAAAILVCGRVFGRRALDLRSWGTGSSWEIARYAGPLLVTNSVYTLYAVIDSLLIGAILTTSDVGLFSGPMRFVLLLGYVGQSVAGALAPRIARTPEREPDAVTWRAGFRWLLIFQWLLVAPLLVWATPIMVLLLGEGFRASGPVLRALTPYVFLGGLSPVLSTSLNYLGLGARRIPIAVVALLVNIVLDVTLLPLIGVIGAAIGTGVAYAIYIAAHLRICRQAFDIPLRPLAATTARSALGAAAMAFVLLGVGTGNLFAIRLVAGLAAGTVVFVLVLFATREVRPAEVRTLIGFVRKRVMPA